jgi:hypothetical protein
MRATLCLIGLLVLGPGCGNREEEPKTAEPLTRRQRDSVIGASGLPGARGVQRALTVADSAAARRALEDSIAREP